MKSEVTSSSFFPQQTASSVLTAPEAAEHSTMGSSIAFYDFNTDTYPGTLPIVPAHWHAEYEIAYVFEGEINISLNGDIRTIHAGEAVFIDQNIIHAYAPCCCAHVHYVCIPFLGSFVFPSVQDPLYGKYFLALRLGQKVFSPLISAHSDWGRRMLHCIRLLAESGAEQAPGCELEWRSLLLQCFSIAESFHVFTRTDTDENPVRSDNIRAVRAAIQYLEQNYAEPVSIRELALQAGYVPEYFCRLFRSIVQQTPTEFLTLCRLNHAQSLLTHTRMQIGEIASACGFSDMNYFSRCFKKNIHMTPREYRTRFT